MPWLRLPLRTWLHAMLLGGVLGLAACGGDPGVGPVAVVGDVAGVDLGGDGGGASDAITPEPPPDSPPAPLQAPAAPVLSVSPQAIKTLNLSWGAVDGATHYQLLEDATGSSGYTLLDTLDGQEVEHALELFLPERINARYLLEACNAAGCTASAAQSVAGTLDAAVGYVKAGVVGAGDQFGFAVALSGDGQTLAVGAPWESGADRGVDADPTQQGASSSGAVYVFVRGEQGWAQQAYLKASNADPGDLFGYSVALSHQGRTLVVGAPFERSRSTTINDGEDDNGPYLQGAVYVFASDGHTWTQEAYVKPASNSGSQMGWGGPTGASFGSAVAVSAEGDVLAVGAPSDHSNATGIDGNGNNSDAPFSGAVFMFSRAGSTWSQEAFIKPTIRAGTYFGESVALSADGLTLAVGYSRETRGVSGINSSETAASSTDSGAVYVYTFSSGAWAQQAYIKSSHTQAGQRFGASVSLAGDGNTLAVGAYGDRSVATGIAPDGPHDTAGAITNLGAAYVFVRQGSVWAQDVYIKPATLRANGAYFGQVVSLSATGDRLAIFSWRDRGTGAGLYAQPDDQSGVQRGAVDLFHRSMDTWTQGTYFKHSVPSASDGFGWSLSWSADGATLAAGIPFEDGTVPGIGGDPSVTGGANDSGAVALY